MSASARAPGTSASRAGKSSIMALRRVLSLVANALLAVCSVPAQQSGLDALSAGLGGAPTRVDIAGVALAMEASCLIDATPSASPSSEPLRVAASISAAKGEALPYGIALVEAWLLLPDGEIDQAQRLSLAPVETPGSIEASVTFDASVAAGQEVRVVAELDEDGSSAFLGSPPLRVEEAIGAIRNVTR